MAKLYKVKKQWYRSKTIWFNIASGAGLALFESRAEFQAALPPWAYGVMVAGLIVGNVILRFSTADPIREPKAK